MILCEFYFCEIVPFKCIEWYDSFVLGIAWRDMSSCNDKLYYCEIMIFCFMNSVKRIPFPLFPLVMIKYQRPTSLNHWKWNFSMTLSVRPSVGSLVGWSVCLFWFSKGAGSFTPMLLSEHMFYCEFCVKNSVKRDTMIRMRPLPAATRRSLTPGHNHFRDHIAFKPYSPP